jgi:transcriptional regulator with XRE-family HTH domain
MDNKEIGKMIQTRRLSRGMTQEQLASAIGVSPSAIGMYEAGRRRPKDHILEALADVFNVPKWAILYKEDEVIPKSEDDDAIWARRETLRRDPKRKLLFDLAENGTQKDIDAAVALIDALRATNPDFYDGDDPA